MDAGTEGGKGEGGEEENGRTEEQRGEGGKGVAGGEGVPGTVLVMQVLVDVYVHKEIWYLPARWKGGAATAFVLSHLRSDWPMHPCNQPSSTASRTQPAAPVPLSTSAVGATVDDGEREGESAGGIWRVLQGFVRSPLVSVLRMREEESECGGGGVGSVKGNGNRSGGSEGRVMLCDVITGGVRFLWSNERRSGRAKRQSREWEEEECKSGLQERASRQEGEKREKEGLGCSGLATLEFGRLGAVLDLEDRLGMVPDARGGLFCDEPGLGKTVTALALILKTKGLLPAVPRGSRLVVCGRKGENGVNGWSGGGGVGGVWKGGLLGYYERVIPGEARKGKEWEGGGAWVKQAGHGYAMGGGQDGVDEIRGKKGMVECGLEEKEADWNVLNAVHESGNRCDAVQGDGSGMTEKVLTGGSVMKVGDGGAELKSGTEMRGGPFLRGGAEGREETDGSGAKGGRQEKGEGGERSEGEVKGRGGMKLRAEGKSEGDEGELTTKGEEKSRGVKGGGKGSRRPRSSAGRRGSAAKEASEGAAGEAAMEASKSAMTRWGNDPIAMVLALQAPNLTSQMDVGGGLGGRVVQSGVQRNQGSGICAADTPGFADGTLVTGAQARENSREAGKEEWSKAGKEDGSKAVDVSWSDDEIKDAGAEGEEAGRRRKRRHRGGGGRRNGCVDGGECAARDDCFAWGNGHEEGKEEGVEKVTEEGRSEDGVRYLGKGRRWEEEEEELEEDEEEDEERGSGEREDDEWVPSSAGSDRRVGSSARAEDSTPASRLSTGASCSSAQITPLTPKRRRTAVHLRRHKEARMQELIVTRGDGDDCKVVADGEKGRENKGDKERAELGEGVGQIVREKEKNVAMGTRSHGLGVRRKWGTEEEEKVMVVQEGEQKAETEPQVAARQNVTVKDDKKADKQHVTVKGGQEADKQHVTVKGEQEAGRQHVTIKLAETSREGQRLTDRELVEENCEPTQKLCCERQCEAESELVKKGVESTQKTGCEGQCGADSESERNLEAPQESETVEKWVSCDECGKWRKVPGSYTYPENQLWFCGLNPDPARRVCSDPEESASADSDISSLPGFCLVEAAFDDGLPANVSLFVERIKSRFRRAESELEWSDVVGGQGEDEREGLGLGKVGLGEVHLGEGGLGEVLTGGLGGVGAGGVIDSTGRNSSHASGTVDGAAAAGDGDRGGGAGGGAGGAGGAAGTGEAADTGGIGTRGRQRAKPNQNARGGGGSWVLPPSLSPQLTFDFASFRHALAIVDGRNGLGLGVQDAGRVFLHIALRVCVYDGANQKAPAVHSLAWDYDVVVTTFSRLSVEWGGGEEKEMGWGGEEGDWASEGEGSGSESTWWDSEEEERGEEEEEGEIQGEEERGGEGDAGTRGHVERDKKVREGRIQKTGGVTLGEQSRKGVKRRWDGQADERNINQQLSARERSPRYRQTEPLGCPSHGWQDGGRRPQRVARKRVRLGVKESRRIASPLLRIHWLRVILDEGHTLGASLAATNKLRMAMALRAARRWILTGTPTPSTPTSQVAHLFPLLSFLHEPIYGRQQGVWERAVQKPFEAGRPEGRQRLVQVLTRCMFVGQKEGVLSIPRCDRKVKLLSFSPQHAASYNEFFETVQRNLLLADWMDPSHEESLLNPQNLKQAKQTLNNVRLSCCVAGHMESYDLPGVIDETMQQLVQGGLEPGSGRFEEIRAALKGGCCCERCGEWVRLPIVTPCAHLLCITCVATDKHAPGCSRRYRMQEPKDMKRPENANPKWSMPQDLIELQPSYEQTTASTKVDYLLSQLRLLAPILHFSFTFPRSPPPLPLRGSGIWNGRRQPAPRWITFSRSCACSLPFSTSLSPFLVLLPPFLSEGVASGMAGDSQHQGGLPSLAAAPARSHSPLLFHFSSFSSPPSSQREWHLEWQATASTKVDYLLSQLRLLAPPPPPAPPLPGSELSAPPLSTASPPLYPPVGPPLLSHSIQSPSAAAQPRTSTERGQQMAVLPRPWAQGPVAAGGLGWERDGCGGERDGYGREKGRYDGEKAIVFTQFLEHIALLEAQLTLAGVNFAGLYNPRPQSVKMQELLRFQHDPACRVLLMNGTGSPGLDLSFVSRVFLMEPVWDPSVEEQMVSRAHRMGASRPITVETLAMAGTLEEHMLHILQRGAGEADAGKGGSGTQRRRAGTEARLPSPPSRCFPSSLQRLPDRGAQAKQRQAREAVARNAVVLALKLVCPPLLPGASPLHCSWGAGEAEARKGSSGMQCYFARPSNPPLLFLFGAAPARQRSAGKADARKGGRGTQRHSARPSYSPFLAVFPIPWLQCLPDSGAQAKQRQAREAMACNAILLALPILTSSRPPLASPCSPSSVQRLPDSGAQAKQRQAREAVACNAILLALKLVRTADSSLPLSPSNTTSPAKTLSSSHPLSPAQPLTSFSQAFSPTNPLSSTHPLSSPTPLSSRQSLLPSNLSSPLLSPSQQLPCSLLPLPALSLHPFPQLLGRQSTGAACLSPKAHRVLIRTAGVATEDTCEGGTSEGGTAGATGEAVGNSMVPFLGTAAAGSAARAAEARAGGVAGVIAAHTSHSSAACGRWEGEHGAYTGQAGGGFLGGENGGAWEEGHAEEEIGPCKEELSNPGMEMAGSQVEKWGATATTQLRGERIEVPALEGAEGKVNRRLRVVRFADEGMQPELLATVLRPAAE
ncbi:unnamed protein product [Closterium sp. Naga37s-1]|nr:unnamed protein product [Closterium sp. Naga37s-1]